MLYYEFLDGTRAPDNMLSYVIYAGLNRIYMRHDEYTKEEAYRDGQKILEDLNQVATVKRLVSKTAYYHGFGNPFTYRCGHCGVSVNEEDVYCKCCGAVFVFTQEDEKAEEANNRQGRRKEEIKNEKQQNERE